MGSDAPLPSALAPLRVRTTPPAPQLLDLRGVASRLALSARTVRRLAADGELSCVRIGRSLRFEEAEVAGFIQRHRVG